MDWEQKSGADAVLMKRRIGGQSPYAMRIRNVMMRLHGRTPSIETVAGELKVSPRGLRRHQGE